MFGKLTGLIAGILLAVSCTSTEQQDDPGKLSKTGTGEFTHIPSPASGKNELKVFYHIPEGSMETSPVLMALHGNGRDAAYTRDVFAPLADEKGILVIVPEFSETDFPGGDAYNLGNIFFDGDNPSPATLNPSSEWIFALFEPLFADFKEKFGVITPKYDLFGHSAGAQVAHRSALFLPGQHLNRVVCSAAGWYTVPDNQIPFPYGLDLSPAQDSDLGTFFFRELLILVGTADNDPDAYGLRHNDYADAQGLNRFDRAQHFYIECLKIANESGFAYNFQYFPVEGAGHDIVPTSIFAMDRLYAE
jgi:pimeloyl-ACP methyl ester carboxylesterase